AALKQRGVPARARVGFADYFKPGHFEDHWVCEYWNAAQQRWVLVDPQLDDVQRKAKNIDFDPLDVPPDRFLIAGAAYRQCRTGERDPERFGISFVGLYGLWFVAANILRDAAALNGVEMLPWDIWGGMKQGELSAEDLAFFDQLARLTCAPDDHLEQLQQLFRSDARLKLSQPSAS
ncbi:MAG TPA: transglutaminase domain-containing protein, partial [Polyangiales bacterium]|nr:transglutaminase domain-containing protein [Polyangiales bacterium]